MPRLVRICSVLDCGRSGRLLYEADHQRFISKISMPSDEACWEWTAHRNQARGGYGTFRFGGVPSWAHRIAFEHWVEDIPDGFHVHHTCRNTGCVNPNHLEAVSPSAHAFLAESPPTQNSRKTHCKHGHAFDEANTYIKKTGKRDCRACHRRQEAERQRRVRAVA